MSKETKLEFLFKCRVEGEGPTLVLLHGFGGSPADWKEVSARFSDRFQVVTPFMSHFMVGGDFGFSEHVQALERFLEDLVAEKGKVYLAGASYGGALAWALRATAPELIEKLVLVNPMPPYPIERMKSSSLRTLMKIAKRPWLLSLYLWSHTGKKTLRGLAEAVRPDWKSRFHRFHLILSKKQKLVFYTIHRFSQILFREDWAYWDHKISQGGCETQLILSEDDQLFGTAHSDWMGKVFGPAPIHILADTPHMAVKTNPEGVYEIMLEFLRREECPLEETA